MAFIWTDASVGKVEVTAHVNEAKDNIDTLADNLGVSQYSWTEMPVAEDEGVNQPQIQELQDATDYVDSVNICSSEKAGNDSSIEGADDSTVYATADASANPDYDATVDGTKNEPVNTSLNTGIDGTKYDTLNSSKDLTVDTDQHGTFYGSQYVPRDVAADDSDCDVYNGNYWPSNY